MDIQDWFALAWTGWISLKSKRLSRVFSNTTVQKHQFYDIIAVPKSSICAHRHTHSVHPQPNSPTHLSQCFHSKTEILIDKKREMAMYFSQLSQTSLEVNLFSFGQMDVQSALPIHGSRTYGSGVLTVLHHFIWGTWAWRSPGPNLP